MWMTILCLRPWRAASVWVDSTDPDRPMVWFIGLPVGMGMNQLTNKNCDNFDQFCDLWTVICGLKGQISTNFKVVLVVHSSLWRVEQSSCFSWGNPRFSTPYEKWQEAESRDYTLTWTGSQSTSVCGLIHGSALVAVSNCQFQGGNLRGGGVEPEGGI